MKKPVRHAALTASMLGRKGWAAAVQLSAARQSVGVCIAGDGRSMLCMSHQLEQRQAFNASWTGMAIQLRLLVSWAVPRHIGGSAQR